jgi:hypothetical protein
MSTNLNNIIDASIERYGNDRFMEDYFLDLSEVKRDAFIEGAEWILKNTYSEAEVLSLLLKYRSDTEGLDITEWFDKFKKINK